MRKSAREKDGGNRRNSLGGGRGVGGDYSKMMLKTSSKVTDVASMESNTMRLNQEKEGSRRTSPREKNLTDILLNAFDNNMQSFATWKEVCG